MKNKQKIFQVIYEKFGKVMVMPVKAISRNYVKKWFRRIHGFKIISIKVVNNEI